MVSLKTNNEHLAHPQPDTLLAVRDIVPQIAKTDSYRSTRDAITNESDPENRLLAIYNGAEEMKHRETRGEYLTLAGHQFNLMSHLVTFMDSVQSYETLANQGASFKDKQPYTEAMATFNHALKDMVDDNPRLKYTDVLQFLRETHQTIHGRSLNKLFENKIRARLTGMRHEIGVEQMLYQMPDIELEDTTINDDLHGGDVRVSLDGVNFYNIDIKASAFTAERTKQNAAYNNSSRIIIWSHLEEGDFNGTFHLPTEIAQKKAPEVYHDIQSAILSRRGLIALRAL